MFEIRALLFRAGGFTQASSPMLESGGDLKVAPDGNYALGTNADGVRVFTPQGMFVRQYGDGGGAGVTFVPGNRLWAGGAGPIVKIFDTVTSAQVGSFSAGGQVNSGLLRYDAGARSVLMVDPDRDDGGVYERDLAGNLLQEFHVPHAQIPCNGAVRGPNGDVFATHAWYAPSYPDLIHWSPNGTVLEEKAIWPVEILPGTILWAGTVPEPGAAALIIGAYAIALPRTERRQRTTRRR